MTGHLIDVERCSLTCSNEESLRYDVVSAKDRYTPIGVIVPICLSLHPLLSVLSLSDLSFSTVYNSMVLIALHSDDIV